MRLALVFLALFALTCRKPEAAQLPPVIVISIDTLRSDRLPVYGYRAIETPAFDAFRRDAVLFERAYSHAPLTRPSHASMFTGLLPSQHGARDNVGFRMNTADTVATKLKARGYATGGAVSALVLRAATGINAGFDSWNDDVDETAHDKSLGAVQRSGAKTIAVAQQWIAAQEAKPFFFFLHLYEPHAPYDAPAPYRSRAKNAYDAEVLQSDALLGGFLAFLKERGIYERAMVVVVSDHGEGLGDHGEDEHGIFLYREAIQVPLLVKLPANARAGETVKTPVGLIELAPMILNRDVDVAAKPVYSETFYPRFHFGWSELHSLIDGDEHYIDAPRAELYDLARDPGERTNLLVERRRSSARLREAIAPLKRDAAAPAPVDAEEARKLAALGYVGSAAVVSGALPDPKDRTATFGELREAFRLYNAGDDANALARFERILEENPNMIDVHDARAKVLLRLGRTSEAIAAGREALRRSPASVHLALDVANAMLLAGDHAGAEQHARLAIKSDAARAHELLARIALARGDVATAEREAQLAGNDDAARFTRARVAQKRGRFVDVLRLTQGLDASGVRTLRGDAHARLGNMAEAERAFREELRLSPGDAEANRALIVLLASQGRNDEATNAIREFARVAPNARTYETIAQTLDVLGDREGARYWRQRAR